MKQLPLLFLFVIGSAFFCFAEVKVESIKNESEAIYRVSLEEYLGNHGAELISFSYKMNTDLSNVEFLKEAEHFKLSQPSKTAYSNLLITYIILFSIYNRTKTSSYYTCWDRNNSNPTN